MTHYKSSPFATLAHIQKDKEDLIRSSRRLILKSSDLVKETIESNEYAIRNCKRTMTELENKKPL